jgi:hypothetical protein
VYAPPILIGKSKSEEVGFAQQELKASLYPQKSPKPSCPEAAYWARASAAVVPEADAKYW